MESNRLTNENGKPIVPIARDDSYLWVKGEVREIVSLFRDVESIRELGDPSLWVWGGSDAKVQFLLCSVEDMVFHKSEGWEYFYMYTTVLLDLGVRFPFSHIECGVLNQLKCAPSQIHPNAWAFIRGFEVLMDYLGGDDGGLKNFFKMRNERELSTSNVVKSEQGVVVNQPSVKRKSISVKRRRAEEGTSEKGKVIDLTSSKCCGKQVSLDEVKMFTENQKKLHEYFGAKDLSSL
ncbi:hypothetical protein PIB30_055054 [Stylosanthes scabra]|uniref:Uncharacterized protein n=1 Tax=Stylosanthes scabra TaxID=79078 RepID=A0ABU6WHD3_9FABA|nr:hypothetical protein [Stylosanthes scabra]